MYLWREYSHFSFHPLFYQERMFILGSLEKDRLLYRLARQDREKERPTLEKKIGFCYRIQISCYIINMDFAMLATFVFFWNKTTKIFYFSYGMIGPTLFDMSSITGLKPDGEVIHMLIEPKFDIKVPVQSPAFSTLIQQHCQETDDVSNEEHAAFLTLWLLAYFLCSKFVHVTKAYVSLANLLL